MAKIKEVNSTSAIHRVITYNAEQTKAVYHNKKLQHVSGCIYRGESEHDGYNESCDIYVIYPNNLVGMWIGNILTDYSIEEVEAAVKRNKYDTVENFISLMEDRARNNKHVRLHEIEFAKSICPYLVDALNEARRVFSEKQEKERLVRERAKKAEEQVYIQDRNNEAELIVDSAINTIKSGGVLQNDTVTFYKSKYDSSTYSIINYLMRKYNVHTPIRTQGWINDKLVNVTIHDGKCEHLQFYKSKGSQCSQKFFDCMNTLITNVIESEK